MEVMHPRAAAAFFLFKKNGTVLSNTAVRVIAAKQRGGRNMYLRELIFGSAVYGSPVIRPGSAFFRRRRLN